jgi:hypothetical protein
MKIKKCKTCKKEFEPIKQIQPRCFSCTLEFARKVVTKQRNDAKKIERQRMKKSLMGKSDYEQDLQRKINLLIRLIDVNCPCVSSGLFGKMSAGHRFSVGSNNSIRFNLFNIWIQSFHDNFYNSGNPDGYDKFLKENNIYELVHEVPEKYKFIKLSKEELIEKIELVKGIIKELKNLNKTLDIKSKRTIEARIYLRKRYNKELGIYL